MNWNKVADEMPPDNTNVLIYLADQDVYGIGCINHEDEGVWYLKDEETGWYTSIADWELVDPNTEVVTHWMPLPPLPGDVVELRNKERG